MATQQTTPLIHDLLSEARGGNSKASVYKVLDVTPQTYDTWENGVYVPGDEYAERLAAYFEMPLPDMVWVLYVSRRHRDGYPPSVHVMSSQMSLDDFLKSLPSVTDYEQAKVA